MISRFISFVEAHGLFTPADKVLLAVSGGMDSMAMAGLFRKAGYRFAIAHCNFMLRGEEADADQQFVEDMAREYGVDCHVKRFHTMKIAGDTGRSVQMVARELRYGFFDEIAAEHHYQHVAIAHHLDDQTETFFINLMRGCGIAGLHGIRLKQGKVVRPLMFAFRRDIEQYVAENNIPFREDSSNPKMKYARNIIRHKIIPEFVGLNPSFREEMAATISRISDAERIYQHEIENQRSALLQYDGRDATLDLMKLRLLDPLPGYLYELISAYGFGKDDVMNIIRALDGISGKQFLSNTHRLVIDREKILISPLHEITGLPEVYIKKGDTAIEFPVKLSIRQHEAGNYNITADKHTAAFDMDKLAFPLLLRPWQRGDAFIPLGMRKRKKVSDLLIDEKIPLPEKDRIMVLCSGDEIVWVVGMRISDNVRITTRTRKVLEIVLDQ